MSRLFLIRHGPTHQTVFTGWRDVPADLSDTAAVARMRDHLPGDVPVISSDLIRSVATADAIAGSSIRLPHDADLREFDFGAWDGLGFEAVGDRDPVLSRAFWDDPGDVTPPGGESWNDVKARVSAAIARHMADHGDLIVVAHFGAILCQIGHLTGQPPKQIIAQKIDPLSVSELRLRGGYWHLEMVNHTLDPWHHQLSIDARLVPGLSVPMTYDLLIGQQSYSSWSMRAWLCFAPFDIPVTLRKVEIYGDSFHADVAAFGGTGTVPAARTPEGGLLTDSMAIAWHVAEAFAERAVMPKAATERAEAMSIMAEMHTGFTALRGNCQVNLRNAWAGFDPSAAVLADVARFEEIMGRALDRSGGPFLYGAFTLADAFYAPLATRLLTYGLPMSDRAQAYAKAIVTHPSFVEWRTAGMEETQEIARYDKAPLQRIPFPTFS